MSIQKCCENCIYFVDGIGEQYCCKFKNSTISTPRVFIPREELVRQDERKNIIDLILNSKFYIKDNGKVYDVLVNELKPKTIDTFEESIIENERNKIITLLKSDLENYEGLASEDLKNNNIDNLIGNNAVRRYIEETIEVLKEK